MSHCTLQRSFSSMQSHCTTYTHDSVLPLTCAFLLPSLVRFLRILLVLDTMDQILYGYISESLKYKDDNFEDKKDYKLGL
jgi:hypothetical protein